MTPKEKADSLVDTYRQFLPYYSKTNNFKRAVGSALIAVDEILWEIIKYADNSREYVVENSKYWQEVKQEIEKL